MDALILYNGEKLQNKPNITIRCNIFLVIFYIIMEQHLQAMFWEFKMLKDRIWGFCTSRKNERIRYTGALETLEKSITAGPHKCSFCVVAGTRTDKKKKEAAMTERRR